MRRTRWATTTTRAAASLLLLLSVAPARACPICDSEQGRSIREGLFDGRVLINVSSLLAPFPFIIAGAVLGARFLIPRGEVRRPPRRAGA